MSGVGISGLIANLPGTVTPYPTQDPNLELGGYRQVADATARDAIPAAFRALGMLVTLQNTGVTYQLFGGLTNANWIVYKGGAFKGLYYVDPTFTGPQLGSQSNPFTTYAAAFAFAAALGLTNGRICQAGGTNVVEAVTFPTTGEWEIQGQVSPGNLSACVITGNMTLSSTAARRAFLTDIQIAGNLSGATSAGVTRITCQRASVTGTTTFTVSGSGVFRIGMMGGCGSGGFQSAANMAYCFFTGAVSVQGTIWASTTTFASTVSYGGRSTFFNTNFSAAVTATDFAGAIADDTQSIFTNCNLGAQTVNSSNSVGGRLNLVSGTCSNFDGCTINFTGAAINVFGVDDTTGRSFYSHGGVVTGLPATTPPVALVTARATALTNNRGAAVLAAKSPLLQHRACATLTLVTPGTLGNAVLNIIYTDSLGVSRTKPVCTLNIAGAAGDEAQGIFVFTQDGSTNFQYSVTGITTPGALSYNLCVSIEPS